MARGGRGCFRPSYRRPQLRFFKHLIILRIAFGRPHLTSDDQNGVKTTLQPILALKVFVLLCIPAFSRFMAHPNICLRFRVTGRRVKKFRFSLISVAAPQKILVAYYELNFDADDLPHS